MPSVNEKATSVYADIVEKSIFRARFHMYIFIVYTKNK